MAKQTKKQNSEVKRYYQVSGQITDRSGKAPEPYIVQCYHKEIGCQTLLGKDVCKNGQYQINIPQTDKLATPFYFFIKVLKKKGKKKEVAEEVLFKSRLKEFPKGKSGVTVDVKLNVGTLPAIVQPDRVYHFTQVHQTLKSYIPDPEQLVFGEEDYQFVALQSGIDAQEVALYTQARLLEKKGMDLEVGYVFAKNPELFFQSEEEQRTAIHAAKTEGLISNHEQLKKSYTAAAKHKKDLLVDAFQIEGGFYERVFELNGLNKNERISFLQTAIDLNEEEDFWSKIKVKTVAPQRLKFSFQLFRLFAGDEVLTDKVQSLLPKDTELKSLIGNKKVASLIAKHADKETIPWSAAAMQMRMDIELDKRYPNETLLHAIESTPAGKKIIKAKTYKLAVDYLKKSQNGFNILTTDIGTYFAESKDKKAPEVVKQLKAFQYANRMVPAGKRPAVAMLLENGYDAPMKIAQVGPSNMQLVLSDSGLTKREINKISKVAERSTAEMVMMKVKYKEENSPYGTFVIKNGEDKSPQERLKEIIAKRAVESADLESLFGGNDYCACKHCQSVLSPAAYFVDLMLYLKYIPNATGTTTALDELLKRRPDLKSILLSCENSKTLMPYIDLVNEQLELIVDETSKVADYKKLQTTYSAEKLKIEPEHHHEAAYNKLEGVQYPWTLPFNYKREEANMYLEVLGTSLKELEEVRGVASSFWVNEKGTLGQDRFLTKYYGENTSTDLAKDVNLILSTTGLDYDTFYDLLQTDFINKDGEVKISYPEECSLVDAKLIGSGDKEKFFKRLHQFVRIQRRLDWSIVELDRVLMITETLIFDDSKLDDLYHIFKISKERNLEPSIVASWAMDLDLVDLDTKEYALKKSKELALSEKYNNKNLGTVEGFFIAPLFGINGEDFSYLKGKIKSFDSQLNLNLYEVLQYVDLILGFGFTVDEVKLIFDNDTTTESFEELDSYLEDLLEEIKAVLEKDESVQKSNLIIEQAITVAKANGTTVGLIHLVKAILDFDSTVEDNVSKDQYLTILKTVNNKIKNYSYNTGNFTNEITDILDTVGISIETDSKVVGWSIPMKLLNAILSYNNIGNNEKDILLGNGFTAISNDSISEALADVFHRISMEISKKFQWSDGKEFIKNTIESTVTSGDWSLIKTGLEKIYKISILAKRLDLTSKEVENFDSDVTTNFLSNLEFKKLGGEIDFNVEPADLQTFKENQLTEKLGLSTSSLSTIDPANLSSVKTKVEKLIPKEEWNKKAPDARNKLRERQRDALLSYVLHNSTKHKNKDVTELYEHLLFDSEMQACMMTSRLKLAISGIQLFIQRVGMGLEKWTNSTDKILLDDFSKSEWKWRKNYRVWEANRKVFLFPENWIEPELRDDKSQFFQEFENALLQGEMNEENIERAYLDYLDKLHEVSKMEILGMCWEEEKGLFHVFARTKGIPHKYFYRNWKKDIRVWSSWETLDLDIEGRHLYPIVFAGRLYLFWALFEEKERKGDSNNDFGNETVEELRKRKEDILVLLKEDIGSQTKIKEEQIWPIFIPIGGKLEYKSIKGRLSEIQNIDKKIESKKIKKYYEIKLGFSFYKNGIWEPTKTTTSHLETFDFYEESMNKVDFNNNNDIDFRTEIVDGELIIRPYYKEFGRFRLFSKLERVNDSIMDKLGLDSDQIIQMENYVYGTSYLHYDYYGIIFWKTEDPNNSNDEIINIGTIDTYWDYLNDIRNEVPAPLDPPPPPDPLDNVFINQKGSKHYYYKISGCEIEPSVKSKRIDDGDLILHYYAKGEPVEAPNFRFTDSLKDFTKTRDNLLKKIRNEECQVEIYNKQVNDIKVGRDTIYPEIDHYFHIPHFDFLGRRVDNMGIIDEEEASISVEAQGNPEMKFISQRFPPKEISSLGNLRGLTISDEFKKIPFFYTDDKDLFFVDYLGREYLEIEYPEVPIEKDNSIVVSGQFGGRVITFGGTPTLNPPGGKSPISPGGGIGPRVYEVFQKIHQTINKQIL